MYRFGEFALDPRRRILLRAGSPISLTPKALDVLVFLLQNPNRLVPKEELLRAVWKDTFVEDGNLTQYISHLRKALGDNPEDARLIVTIARKGYQFVGEVVFSPAEPAAEACIPVPATTGTLSDAISTSSPRRIEAVPSRPKSRLGIAVVVSSIIVLSLVCYLFLHLHQAQTSPKTDKVMLAVLPFQNLTGDPSKEYLADGLTEETISQLSRLNPEQLGVIARTSVMGYKHKEERLDQIGRDLSVQYVLENSLRESGDRIRLTAQLIQVKDQTHLWSQDYDYPARDVLNIEDDVARAVAHEIRVRLTSNQQAELTHPRPVNPQAFDAYMRGYYYFERDTDKDTDMSAKYFERATQLDPSYALAWAGLSRARLWQVNVNLIPAEKGHRLARESVERALALNPKLAEAHAQMGRIQQQVDFDWTGAAASFERALALDSGSPEVVRSAAFSAATLGRFDEALALNRRAVNVDPLNAESWEQRGELEYFEGQFAGSKADFTKALELNPDVVAAHAVLTRIYLLQGRPHDALSEIEFEHYDVVRSFLYAITYHALGREKDSGSALSELITKYHAGSAYQIAQVYAFENQPDKAFEWLDQAYSQHDGGLVVTKVDPLLKNLHRDPRFSAFLQKIHLPLSM